MSLRISSGNSQHRDAFSAFMKRKIAKYTRLVIAVASVVCPMALPSTSVGQGLADPGMGGRLGQGTFVSPDFVLNLDVQIGSADGTPLKSMAVVTLYAPSGLPISTTTTRGAHALFAQLAPGPYYVEVEAPGFWKTREDAVVDPSLGESIVKVSMMRATGGGAPVVYYHTPLLAPDVQKELNKGVALLKANKLGAAEKPLRFVLKKAPNNPAVLYVMGMAAEKKGNIGEARSYWEKAISFDPTQEITVYALGQSYLREGNFTRAGELGQKALELNPNSWKAHVLLASAAFRQDNYVEAVSHGERALELGKEQAASISIVLSQALAVQGRREEAIQVLNRFLATKPDSAQAAIAVGILSRLQNKADRFVIAGSEAAKTVAEVPQPAVSPFIEHWVPPDIDAAVPPVELGATCDLADVLAKAGEQLRRLPESLDRFSATERLQHQYLNENGIASNLETLSFAYVVSIHETRPGTLNVEEYRNGRADDSVFPDHFATRGLPSQVFVFHPYYQPEFDMKCEGLARQGIRFAWQVRFEQKKDVPSRMQVHYLNGKRFPVPLKGRAWIDTTNYQVVHLETDLREPVKAAGLFAQHTDIEYGPVRFKKDNQELWLPIRAKWFVQTRAHRLHRVHDLSNFVLFAVEDKQTIGKPKDTPEQQ